VSQTAGELCLYQCNPFLGSMNLASSTNMIASLATIRNFEITLSCFTYRLSVYINAFGSILILMTQRHLLSFD